jgi:hypothetical protein
VPILDHFHPPLRDRRSWRSFHTTWTASLVDALTAVLPEAFLVEETAIGALDEIHDSRFEAATVPDNISPVGAATAIARAKLAVIPAPALTMPAIFPGDFEVRVFCTKAGPRLVAAIELISPGNKNRPESRRAFATRCASYLDQGISLIMVDIVTEHSPNLHNDTMRLMKAEPQFELPAETSLYAVAYRPVRRAQREEIDLWPTRFEVGDRLPTLPLVLNWETCIHVDLEAAYVDACRRRRLT